MKTTMRKFIAYILTASTLVWAGSFGLFVEQAAAADIGTSALVNTFILNGATVKASSSPTALLGLNLAHGTARTLSSVRATVAGPFPFIPGIDLGTLATDATSPIALYADGGVAGGDGVFVDGANGDALVTLGSAPTFVADRNSSLTPASTGSYTINGTANTTTPALAVGDVVFRQSGATAGTWGVVTTALSASALSINGSAVANGTYVISKLANSTASFVVNATDAITPSGAYTTPAAGDIVQYQTGSSASIWGVVTNDTLTSGTFAINGSALAGATYRISKITGNTPTSATTDGSSALTLNLAVGDLVLARVTAGGSNLTSWAWHIVTTAENISGATPNALRLDGFATAPTFTASSRVAKIGANNSATSSTNGATYATGDIFFANPVLNAAPVTGYDFHIVTTGVAGGPAIATFRLDGASGAPYLPYSVTLTPASAPSIPADDSTGGNVGSDFYIVVRTASGANNGYQFNVSVYNNADVTISNSDTVSLASLPTKTPTITIDTVAPTVDSNSTGPANNSTGVPISAFPHVGFSEQLDQSTINPTNVTFCSVSACPGGTAVASSIRSFPNGFDVVVSAPPTFAASSRFGKVANTTTAFYQMMGSGTITPQPPSGYSAPVAGDIVITQRETFPPEVGLITNATLTAGTFAVNGFPAFGGMQITEFGSAPNATGLVTTTTALTAGDIVVVNTTANPTDVRYNWHIVTTGAAVNDAALRLDGATGGQPTFVSGSRFSKITPTETIADNGGTGGNVLAVDQGDLVFIKVGSSYGWHLVTTAGNLSSDSGENTAFIDGGAADPAIVASSQMSELDTGAQGAVTASTALSMGDILMAHTTANASNGGAYNFHIVSGADTIANAGGALRFDNFPGSLVPSTTYVLTTTTGVKDSAGNALAANNTLTFTTGATGGTNTTPPQVQSSQPSSGSQNHPTGAPIKLTFSVDMIATGGGSIIDAANIALSTAVNGQPGTAVTTTKTYDSPSKTVTLTPGAALTASTDYVVKINATATSTTGTAINGGQQPYFLFFRTSSGADSTAPTVLGVSPANASTGVSLGAVITAGFSEDMDPATIITGRVKLALTSDLAATVTGNVTYNGQSRSASFVPSTVLTANTSYTFTIVSGASGVKDLSANQLAANYTSTFTTTATADTTKPFISFSNADNFSVAVTFNETMKSGGGPNAADNIANYTLESPTGSTIGLGGKTGTFEAGTKTARITGLSLQNGNTYKITAATVMQDLSSNVVETTGEPAGNTSFGIVQDSSSTGGQIGPGTGTIDPGMQGMNPTRVTPMARSAGATSTYHIEFLASTAIPSTGQIVLTFPAGFTLSGAAAVAVANSFCNADLNGPGTGAPTIGSVAADNDSGTVTITTATAATGTNSFLCMDISGIVNSTVPSSSGYTVSLQTRDTGANNRATLQTLTASPFFLGSTGSSTLTVHVFKDANSDNIKDSGEGVASATVYLFSPASGGAEATTTTGASGGVATFANLANGEYMVGIKPTAAIDVAFNSMPQPITISGDATKKFALSNAAAITISGTVTGTNGTSVDVFASSPNGFAKTTITLTGSAVAYSLPVSPNSSYNVGVGPSIPESFFTPGSAPPPPPDFSFMPPPNLQVAVLSASVTGQNFVLTTTDKTITGTVNDSTGTGISNAGVFCRPVASSTTGTASGFGTGGMTNTSGAFTIKVTAGVYTCGVFKPGMPPASDKQVTVPTTGTNSPASLAFVLDASTTLTITGTIKDDSGNAIPYAGVGGRKVVSTSNTAAIGGDSGNFAGGPTDSNGAYTLYVTAGTWIVEAFAPGFGKLGSKTVTVTTSSLTGQDFSAQTLSIGTITGTVTRAGTTVQGVMVRASGSAGENMANTDSAGAYTLKVPAGTYTVTCFFPGNGESTPITNVAVVVNTTTSAQNCTMAAPITITINITNGTNTPITGAGVDVRDDSGRGNFTNISTTSGGISTYTLTVPPGTYTVRAGHPAYGKIGERTGVNATSSLTFNVEAGQLFAVTGTVTGNGTALSGAWASLTGRPTGSVARVFLGGQTDSTGAFSVSVPAGSYTMRVDKPGYKSPAETTVTVGTAAVSAGTIAMTTAARTIGGTVFLSGVGASNAFVDASDGAGGYAVAQTNAAGVYSLAVDNGSWNITARGKGYQGGPLTVVVAGVNLTGQDITLTAISGFTVKPEKPETVTPTSGGFLTNTDIGPNFQVSIPANALGTGSNAATVTTTSNTSMPNPPTGTIMNKSAVTISAVDSSGSPIKNLNDDIVIEIPYEPGDLPAGTDESSLVLGVYNDATQSYDTLSTTVDTVNNILIATVSHLSDFAPLIPDSGSSDSGSGSGGGGSGGGGGGSSTPAPVAVAPTPTTPTTTTTPSTSNGRGSHPNGTLINDNGTFYLIKNGKRVGFRNANEYKSHGYTFGQAVAANAQDKAMPQAEFVQKALEGTLVLDAADGKTVYMVGSSGTKRGFTSMAVLRGLGYNLSGLPKINLSDYLTGNPIGTSTEVHPDGALVKEGQTIWWIRDGKKTGFESMNVFNTYGFKLGDVARANAADIALTEGAIVKFRDGTLVNDGGTYYLVSDGKKLSFSSTTDLTTRGYKTSNAISASLAAYTGNGSVE